VHPNLGSPECASDEFGKQLGLQQTHSPQWRKLPRALNTNPYCFSHFDWDDAGNANKKGMELVISASDTHSSFLAANDCATSEPRPRL
jgi:hypothetical protein